MADKEIPEADYDKAEYQKRLDRVVADVVPNGNCAERLEEDNYPYHDDGQTVEELHEQNETEDIGGFKFVEK